MAFVWKEDLETGIEKIDFQHKELFKAVNGLIDACHDNKGFKVIDDTITFLLNYTISHFNEEEALQQKGGYPDYPNHKKLHEDFRTQAQELAEKVKVGHSIDVVMELSRLIGDWLIKHIKKEDKKLGEYLKEKGIK